MTPGLMQRMVLAAMSGTVHSPPATRLQIVSCSIEPSLEHLLRLAHGFAYEGTLKKQSQKQNRGSAVRLRVKLNAQLKLRVYLD